MRVAETLGGVPANIGQATLRVEPTPDASQIALLSGFVDLLSKWNRVYNLTAVRERGAMVQRHVDDCLRCIGPLSTHVPPGAPCRLLDVGSGGGLPGVVIAVMLGHVEVTCVDAVGKKSAFVQQVASTLGLPNLHALHSRVEDVTDRFDIVACRAFSSLARFVDVSEHALAVNGVWLAMKGSIPTEELAELDAEKVAFHVEQLPSEVEKRCIVWMRRTDDKFALASWPGH